MWVEIAAIAFSLVFLVVGILRTVEFSGIGLPIAKRRVLVSLHVIGCLLFSSALAQVALDVHEKHRTLAFCLFVAALVLLAPGQITIAIHRRRATGK